MFINKTLSTESLINQLLIKRLGLSISIDSQSVILGKVWGHVSVQVTIYMLVCVSDNESVTSVCQWHNGKCVYVSVCVCVCHSSFSLSRCLFNPHHVNQGGVQKTTPQVTLYESHTVEESLRRHRSVRQSQVMSDHPDQGRSGLSSRPVLCRCVLLYVSGRCREEDSTLSVRVRWISCVKFQILFVINYW